MQWLANNGGQLRCLGLRGCRIGSACARALHVALLPATASSVPSAEVSQQHAEHKEDQEEIQHGLVELDLSSNWMLCGADANCTFALHDYDDDNASLLDGWRTLCGGLRFSLVMHCALVDCHLSAAAAEILGDNMEGWSALRCLDLSRNPLG